ncbi:death-on-curing protein [Clostridium arbusti]|uniref:death-on-curing protein n=1 Tax=Clostridium arbusti TaxID=1137848 RepID=UPI000289663B|nr:death-on-curing protein [Clostridium arbusti]
MDIITLTKEQIYLFHEEALKVYGGEAGIDELTDGKIESILAQQSGYFEYDKYPSVFDKASMLLCFFC